MFAAGGMSVGGGVCHVEWVVDIMQKIKAEI